VQNQINNKSCIKSEEVSFKRRYFAKLISNVVVLVANVIMQSIIPRALGPAAYGNFNFITNFFQQLIGFLNLNTSTTFYTKLSQRQDDKGLVLFYLNVIVTLGLIVAVFVMAGFALGMQHLIWPDQKIIIVILGALWAFLTFSFGIFCEMSDAYGLTVKAEIAKLALKLFSLAIIVAMFWLNVVTLTNFFVYQLFLLLISLGIVIRIIHRNGYPFQLNWRLTKGQWQGYGSEFLKFCLPLVLFSGFATLQAILERWMLQKYSGSAEQGFYGIALQISSICFLCTSAIVPLLAREYSVSYAKNDIYEMKRLFLRFVPMLYTITAYFGCFLAVESRAVMHLFGGRSYSAAVLPIAVMCFYPLHQTYGQLNASLFFATGRTTAYSNIGILIVLISIPLTFFLIGPREYGALNGGAAGLAAKMVAIQLLSTNAQLMYLARLLKLPFLKLLGHQVVIVLLFVPMALTASYASEVALSGRTVLEQFLFSGILYTMAILALLLIVPALTAMKKEESQRLWLSLLVRIKGASQK